MRISWIGRRAGGRCWTAFGLSSLADGLSLKGRCAPRVGPRRLPELRSTGPCETAPDGANPPRVYGWRRRGGSLRLAGWRNVRANRATVPAGRPDRPREGNSIAGCATSAARRAGAGVMLAAAGLVACAALFAAVESAHAQNATGKPVINGYKVEGERLSVNLDGISDPNGGPFTNINILWYTVHPTTNVETFIGHREGTYGIGYWHELVQADVGKKIKVEVNFKDAAGNREYVESNLTAVITARPRVTIHDLTVTEPASGTQTETVRVSLDRASAAGRTIRMNFRNVSGTATVATSGAVTADANSAHFAGSDVVIFAPGETETTITLGINGGEKDTTTDAATEEFYIELSNHQPRWVEVADGRATVTINDYVSDPPEPTSGGGVSIPGTTVQLAFTEHLYIQGSRISGTLPNSVKNAFTVTADGSDVEIASVVRSSNSAVRFNLASGVTIKQGEAVRVSYDRDTAGDNGLEDDVGDRVESFTDHAVPNSSTATRGIDVSIAPKPRTQSRSVQANSGVVTEGSPAEFTLTRNGDADAALTVDVSVTESGSMLRGTPPATVTFDAGSATAELSVPTEDDKVAEPASEVTATVSSGTGYAVDGNGSATVTVEDNDAPSPLTAEFTGVPDEHDGSSAFTFRLAFSENIRNSYRKLRDDLLSATGGTVTRARRVDRRSDLWEIQVEPSGNEAVTVTLAAGEHCSAAPCTSDRRALSETVTATIEGPLSLPTVSVSDADATEGEAVEFTVALSETSSQQVTVAYATSGGTAESGTDFTAQSGTLTFAAGESSKTVSVSSTEDSLDEEDETFTLTLSGPANATLGAAAATGTITDDDDAAPPPTLSVADATVDEGPNAKLRFEITLDHAASETVTVEASTSDGTATAGSDYRAKTLRKTFAPGETRKIAVVTVLDDLHDEGAETLTLTLSNASGALVADGEAIGTIENHDPLPRALMARFGRTAAVHVVEHVEERIEAPRQPGFGGRFAGRELRPGMERELALSFLSQLGGSTGVSGHGVGVHDPMGMPGVGAGPSGPSVLGGSRLGMAAAAGSMGGMSGLGGPTGTAVGPRAGPLAGGPFLMGLGGGNLLTGSALSLNRETRQGGILSFWSRGARSHFSGRDEALSLGGDVQTTMFGADYAKGPLVAGLSLSHSRGLGEYAGVAGGQVASAVTGLYPWLGYKATDRITVWGVAGYGAGGMLLTPDGGPVLESGLSMAMAAAGTRGELVAGGASGFELAFKADALWVGTSSDGVDGPAGRLKATEAAVTRFRTGLEGSRGYTLAGRLSLRPSVEVGLRQDGGDAETGAGMDVGGGLVVSDAGTGLSVDLRVRMLVVHQAEGFRERGMAISLSYNPTPSTPLGFMARVAPSWGGQAQSGAEALWGRDDMAGMAHGSFAQGDRLDGEVGYGLPVGSRLVGTPRVGFSTSEYGREYRVGYGLGVLERGNVNFELGVDAQRRESPMLNGAANGFLGRATLGW